jgi:hypothetical protein
MESLVVIFLNMIFMNCDAGPVLSFQSPGQASTSRQAEAAEAAVNRTLQIRISTSSSVKNRRIYYQEHNHSQGIKNSFVVGTCNFKVEREEQNQAEGSHRTKSVCVSLTDCLSFFLVQGSFPPFTRTLIITLCVLVSPPEHAGALNGI